VHYYKRNLGDYAKKAGRLSMLQHGAYTLLIDACYDREQFPTMAEAIDWTWASSTAEIEAVEFVLRKFFALEDGRYVQKRIQEEIADYHAKSETNTRIAAEREANRRAKNTKRERVADESSPPEHEPPPNQEPITINHQPINTHCASDLKSGDVCKAMKQAGIGDVNPGNQTLKALIDAGATLDEFTGAAAKAVDSSKGFAYALGIVKRDREQAASMADKLYRGELPAAETTYQRSMRERMAEAAPMFARAAPSAPQAVHPSQAADFFLELAAKQKHNPPRLEIAQ
jgi:uncharacterized protein YdaU (DUF1376 family)